MVDLRATTCLRRALADAVRAAGGIVVTPALRYRDWTAAELSAQSVAELREEASRQSRSAYLYLTWGERDDDHRSLRVSDHRNPAHNPVRVDDGHDRAELTDYEWRADLGAGFGLPAIEGGYGRLTRYPTWQALAVAIIEDAGLPVPARLRRAAP